MSKLPLYAFVQGDSMGIVVLGRPEATVAELGEDMLRAAGVRIGRRAAFRLTAGARALELAATLGTQGLEALERVDLVWV